MRAHGYRRPLSDRRIEIYPQRATFVQSDQQQLGRRAAGELREDPEVHSHHHDFYRLESESLSGSKRLSGRRKAFYGTAAPTSHHSSQGRAKMELYSHTIKCEVVSAPPLSLLFGGGDADLLSPKLRDLLFEIVPLNQC